MASKLTDLLRRLFSGGRGGGGAATEAGAETVEYKGYTIQPAPERSGGQFRVAGVVRKALPDGEVREHRFIRADTCSTQAEAESFSIEKAKRIIDEQGDRLFQQQR